MQERSQFVSMVAAVAACLVLAACGNSLSGTYQSKSGGVKMVFKSGGKVEMTVMGMTNETDYTVEDHRVKIITPRGTQIMPIDDQGCLEGGFLLGKLCKV